MQFSDPATGFTTGTDEPDLDVMRYATQVAAKRQQPQAEMRAIPKSPFEKIVGAFGKGAESLGKAMAEPLAETQKVAPIKTWLAKTLVTDPLQGAGTALQDWSGTPRDVTPEHPYTPSPFYGGSKATLNPQTWGPALQTFRTDPRVLDVAGVAQPAGALVKATATKVAAPAARMAGEALAQRMLAGESMIPGVSQSVAPNPLMFAVRPQGSTNWVPGFQADSVDRALARLKSAGPTNRDEALMWGGEEWKNMIDTPEGQYSMELNGAVNRWVDKKLKPYVRNDMGTPNDPIRLAHKKGYSHLPGQDEHEFGVFLSQDTADARVKAGFPEEGVSVQEHAAAGFPEAGEAGARKAEFWESLADTEIKSTPAREFQNKVQVVKDHPDLARSKDRVDADLWSRQNPWMMKLPPDTPIHQLPDQAGFNENLGFNHMIDELVNAMDPASNLPANLRLTPKQLDKVSVEQAVERVSKINDWRAAEAKKAEREGMMGNLTATPRLEIPDAKLSFVEKPGMKWIDIPETTDKKGMNLCTTLGKQGGWCTSGEGLAMRYGSGDNRLTTLIDAEGRPHAQAKISKSNYDTSQFALGDVLQEEDALGDQYYRNLQTLLHRRGINLDDAEHYVEMEAGGNLRGIPENIRALINELSPEAERMLPKKKVNPLPDITELKPVGNTFNSQRASEYSKRDPQYENKITDSVLQFLNSREWGKVNDLNHYDIVDMNNPKSVQHMLEDVLGNYHLPAERAALFNEAVDMNPNAPRFMSRSQFSEFVKPPSAPAPDVKPKGFAKGGSVYFAKSVDDMRYELTRKK